MTISLIPACRNHRIWWTISGSLAIGIMGLGMVSVKGRNRLPWPAAKIIAFIEVAQSRPGQLGGQRWLTTRRKPPTLDVSSLVRMSEP